MANNKSLHSAHAAKKDEFYTQLTDIEKELQHYKKHFRGKVVYCNCDDPKVSNFFHYFSYKFESLGLKKLITTCYKSKYQDMFSKNDSEQAIWLEYNGDENENRIPDPEEIGIFSLKDDGDFRSKECINLLRKADIICTNPPFSLFREYVEQLIKYGKKFLIIGNKNAITYKEIFSLIKQNKIWLGNTTGDMEFAVPEYYPPKKHRYRMDENGTKFYSLGSATWFTNLDIEKRHEELIPYKQYYGNENEYPKYDNYDAIEVSKVEYIPKDWGGAMGVPITFLEKYNPDQFEIIKFRKGNDEKDLSINGKCPYFRILIRSKKPNTK